MPLMPIVFLNPSPPHPDFLCLLSIGFDSPGTLDPPPFLVTLLEWLSQPVPQTFPFILYPVKNTPVLSSFLAGALIR